MTERKHRLMVGVMVFTLFLWGISNACIAQESQYRCHHQPDKNTHDFADRFWKYLI